ncbi:hypothetical protein D6783_02350 [Candidatus Woesearchaeota archaeon]|nr:MAG: hypothetical protein D6783_02350 [Candidatus Woesearchaeota archaeon]
MRFTQKERLLAHKACDYHLKGRCLHPKRVPKGVVAIPCVAPCSSHKVVSSHTPVLVLFSAKKQEKRSCARSSQ